MSSRSLRFQILATFLGGLVLSSGMSLLVLYVGGRGALEDGAIRSNRALARAVAQHLSSGMSRGAGEAVRLAARLQDTRGDPTERLRHMQALLDFGDLFGNAYLFREDGTLTLFAYGPGRGSGSARPGENFHSYPGPFSVLADRVLSTGIAGFTPIFHSTSGRAQLAYVAPVLDEAGKPVELISLALYAISDQVNGWINGLAPSPGGYIAVLDPNRRVVALSGEPPTALARAGNVPVVAFGVDGRVAVLDGREDLLIREAVSTAGWEVWVGLPRSVALAPLAQLQGAAVTALFVCALLILVVATRLSRDIVRPLQSLVAGIRRVGDGVLSERVPENRVDELGDAARAFNRMADRLQRDQLVEEIWREVQKK